MRGARIQETQRVTLTRITPAHAGSTAGCFDVCCVGWDHPCSCGEHNERALLLSGRLGITPAHAGSTEVNPRVKQRYQDHPCSCGEHSFKYVAPLCGAGSPLLMRGARLNENNAQPPLRITPAHAGSTINHICNFRVVRDHPCSCGEHILIIIVLLLLIGSPLLMRGALKGFPL